MKLSIILPIYNEKENISQLIQEIEEALLSQNPDLEILAINDSSTDGSLQLLENLATSRPYLKIISFLSNCGQTAAFDAGFRNARGDVIVTMDADLQNDPKDIPKLLKLIEAGNDYVTGIREKRKDGYILRTFPSQIANFIIRKVTNTNTKDLGCSLKAYRKHIIDHLYLYGEMHRFIGVLVESMGVKTARVSVSHRPRVAGVSKYGLNRTFKVLLDLITVWFMKGFKNKPIYVFGGAGLACFGLSLMTLGISLYQKFFYLTKIHRNPLFLISMVLVLVGVQMLGLGLISDMLMRTYYESQNKRPYIISKKVNIS